MMMTCVHEAATRMRAPFNANTQRAANVYSVSQRVGFAELFPLVRKEKKKGFAINLINRSEVDVAGAD